MCIERLPTNVIKVPAEGSITLRLQDAAGSYSIVHASRVRLGCEEKARRLRQYTMRLHDAHGVHRKGEGFGSMTGAGDHMWCALAAIQMCACAMAYVFGCAELLLAHTCGCRRQGGVVKAYALKDQEDHAFVKDATWEASQIFHAHFRGARTHSHTRTRTHTRHATHTP